MTIDHIHLELTSKILGLSASVRKSSKTAQTQRKADLRSAPGLPIRFIDINVSYGYCSAAVYKAQIL